MAQKPNLHLNIFVANAGHHEAAWRYPRTQPERLGELSYYQEIARIAERGKFDSFFLGDRLALGNVRYRAEGRFDPMMLLAALTTCTERIGLVATQSTTYTEHGRPSRLEHRHLVGCECGRQLWNGTTDLACRALRACGRVPRCRHEAVG
jgi:hypothetical protein